MIGRVWHGWTTPENADAFETLLRGEIFTGIRNRRIAGYRGLQLFRRSVDSEEEFVTVMWFDSLESVRDFAGDEDEIAEIPAEAKPLLLRFENRSRHYTVKADMEA